MKTIIAGSRTITDIFEVYMATLACGWIDEITEVVCGASEGQVEYAREALRLKLPPEAYRPNVDINGAVWAIQCELLVTYFPADWNTYGKSAGPIRNEQMAVYGDALILVWDGKSKGSANMLFQAKLYGLRIYEHKVAL